MKCYKCNNELGDTDYCIKCGADVSVYKIVVKASDTYYNLGLCKAKVRDLSGAVSALKTSLKLNKSNINARNLLGLVYFEMGETALALREWVISLNLKSDKNAASAYIRKIKSNPNRLEQLNQAAKKFNLALLKLNEGGDDVALIQLKKVISINPKFIKAYLLTALIYMKKSDNDRAGKMIKKALEIDCNNTLALLYMNDIEKSVPESGDKESHIYNRSHVRGLSGNDVIIPPNSYREPSSGILTVVQILLGVIIGVALVWFLVVPSKVQNVKQESNDTIKKYSEDLAGSSITITNLENKIELINTELESVKSELSAYKGESGTLIMYENLITAVNYYLEEDFDNALIELSKIDVTKLPTETAKSLYTLIDENCSGGAQIYFQAGLNAYNRSDYISAIKYLEYSVKFDATLVEPVYYLAMSHLNLNEKEAAQEYIDRVNTAFANTTYAQMLAEYLSKTNQNTKE